MCKYIWISVCFLVRKVVLACFRLPLIVSLWYDRFSLQFVRVLSTFIYVISCDWIQRKTAVEDEYIFVVECHFCSCIVPLLLTYI